jgi:hypothetical protein
VDQLPLATFNGKDYADFAEYDGLRLFDVSKPVGITHRVASHKRHMMTVQLTHMASWLSGPCNANHYHQQYLSDAKNPYGYCNHGPRI